MPGGDLILAAVLLTLPPGAADPSPPAEACGCPALRAADAPPPPEYWPGLRDAVHVLAIEWEILDPRETRYVFARPDDYAADLALLRRRYQDLLDAPRVADGGRFPDRVAVNDLVRFNRNYRKYLDQRHELETDRAEPLRAAMRETDRLYQVWDAVRDARCEFYYVTVRRQALKRLRELVGEDDYLAGNLPPNVPTWRFADAR